MTVASRLAPAHRGYEYQDLLVACRFVDILLGNLAEAHCDKKFFEGDRFDDLTTIDKGGSRERTQFKHTGNDDRLLTLNTFTTDGRGLRLDELIASILTDRDGPGQGARDYTYRVLLRDQVPDDPTLTAVLTHPDLDPGAFCPGLRTVRLAFDAEALWLQRSDDPSQSSDDSFAFIFNGHQQLTFEDLEWVCRHLVVELGAPRASLDLTEPDLAEQVLLNRVRNDVGAEAFPNTDRSATDVGDAMVAAARSARQDVLVPTMSELLRRTQLRSDFGAVSRSHPVDRSVEVPRPTTVRDLVVAAGEGASRGSTMLVIGSPGQGKSWVCQQLLEALSDAGWLTAEHYCYLGDADGERTERVFAEFVFGSLVGRLSEADPRLVSEQRPRFAADDDVLIGCLRRSLELEPDRKIALVVDGIDHITRVRLGRAGSFDPSKSMAETLASIELPPGSVIIVLSQPGAHLDPLIETGAASTPLPGLSELELQLLVRRLGLIPAEDGRSEAGAEPLLESPEEVTSFLAALGERAKGNALYATYLCREALKSADTQPDPSAAILALPFFDGTLKNYYDHLYLSLGAEKGWVADVVALLDFAVTRAELRDIRPDASHHVDEALKVLGPVLIERATQGGVRVYHESFARYLRTSFQNEAQALTSLLALVTTWLEKRGLFVDARAFRSLLPLLAEAGQYERVVEFVDREFVNEAVAAGFAASAINSNLATAIAAAARQRDWPTIVRYVELSRAAESYQSERFESTLVSFVDVPAALLGAQTLAERLLDEDRLVMSGRAGLQMCAAVDSLGAPAPWRPYIEGYQREAESDNTSYGEESDRAVALAWLRGRLRLASSSEGAHSAADSTPGDAGAPPAAEDSPSQEDRDLSEPIAWSHLAQWVEESDLPIRSIIEVVIDTHGWNAALQVVHSLDRPGSACLAIAESLAEQPGLESDLGSPRAWAVAAVAHGISNGAVHRVLALGVDPADLAPTDVEMAREQLLELTRLVQEHSVQWESGAVGSWLDACAIAAHNDPLGLDVAEASIAGDGWYRCWLRFCIALSRAGPAPSTTKGQLALNALQLLTGDLRPFAGDPRSCDLYSLHGVIAETVSQATGLLDDDQWSEGIQLLKEVSASITTTMFGEIGGPIPPDLLLRIAVDGATPARHDVAQVLIDDEISEGSGSRFYSDLAEYRLLAARLALAEGDQSQAEELWREACIFLTAYGWHKDVTIYEVLDPLPMLIQAAPTAARKRMAHVQALCERVPLHTDKRETRHAWSRWWSLIAKADPVAAVRMSVTEMLRECNDPNWLLNGALEDVWREWHPDVDPVLAGILRLTIDSQLDGDDASELVRLGALDNAKEPAIQKLMTWLLARVDERPVEYGVTNSAQLIARDDEKVANLNRAAAILNLPLVARVDDMPTSGGDSSAVDDGATGVVPRHSMESAVALVGFPSGLPGIARAIRNWRNRPYDTEANDWSADRFSNVIGYRMIELAAEDRRVDVAASIRSLADSSAFGERSGILRAIAEGLERLGETQLAAMAYALAWTRTRGKGGWLTFGGEMEIDLLLRATALDAETAGAIVAEEVENIVGTSRYGTYGVTQALIVALATGALASRNDSQTEDAFAAWDEAFEVIASRAPRVDDSDDPENPYAPPEPDGGELAPGDLEGAFALAALGGLAHPGREKKRRSLLATELLLRQREDSAAPAFAVALESISDPATLTWLLRVIDLSEGAIDEVLEACQPGLRELVSSNFLTVRVIARHMVTGDPPPLAPPTSPEAALLAEDEDSLWVPDGGGIISGSEPVGLDDFIESVAGGRLTRAEQRLNGLGAAVRAKAAISLESEVVEKRLKLQLDVLGDRVRKRWPDALLATEQAIEEVLQSVAAGGRAARLINGEPIVDPIGWEENLGSALLNSPVVPLAVESLRVPRPDLPPPPSSDHDVWSRVRAHIGGTLAEGVQEAEQRHECFLATLSVEPVSTLRQIERGPFGGWHWLGTVEQRLVKHRDFRKEESLVSKRYRVLEVRDAGDRRALTLPPVAAGDLRLWRADVDASLGQSAFESSQPILGSDVEFEMVGDGRTGLGMPDQLLVPTVSLIASLGLRPGSPCSYIDDAGAGLALAIWRAEYDVSDYYLTWPRTCGSGVAIRPDLLDRLVAMVGADRLVVRDFVAGDVELIAKD